MSVMLRSMMASKVGGQRGFKSRGEKNTCTWFRPCLHTSIYWGIWGGGRMMKP